MSRQALISSMEGRGIPVSPFMHYWDLSELVRYFISHTSPSPLKEPS